MISIRIVESHTVPDLLKRVDKDVIAKKPTIVVIQIGCNDARRIPKKLFLIRYTDYSFDFGNPI